MGNIKRKHHLKKKFYIYLFRNEFLIAFHVEKCLPCSISIKIRYFIYFIMRRAKDSLCNFTYNVPSMHIILHISYVYNMPYIQTLIFRKKCSLDGLRILKCILCISRSEIYTPFFLYSLFLLTNLKTLQSCMRGYSGDNERISYPRFHHIFFRLELTHYA